MTRYLGGLITKDESLVLPANNYQDTSAPGVWTLEEAQALNKQGLWPTAGVSDPAKFVENIFSVDTYVGTGGNLTVTTGIDTLNEGGLIWIKDRGNSISHGLFDTVRGTNQQLLSNTNGASENGTPSNNRLYEFTSTGFKVGDHDFGGSNRDYVAWTFRKAPKFFDIVSWTGDNVDGRTISHNLGATPGFIMVKLYAGEGTENWICFHRSLTTNRTLYLNTTDAEANTGMITNVTSTGFDVDNSVAMNATGRSYIAYIFGHDTSSDGMIQCGTVDVDGSNNATVDLGWEPQWFLGRTYTASADWELHDTLRSWNVSNLSKLHASGNNAETTYNAKYSWVTSTGFQTTGYFSGSQSLLYVAIRKAPMATPTTRASVFHVEAKSSGGTQTFTTGFPADLIINPVRQTDSAPSGLSTLSRLQGGNTTNTYRFMNTKDNASELTGTGAGWELDHPNKYVSVSVWSKENMGYAWRRAPKYFDVVLYDGNGSNRTINHNLGVVPDMIWIKLRSSTGGFTRGWVVTSLHLPNATATNDTTLYLDTNAAEVDEAIMNDTGPTSTVFSVSTDAFVNNSSSSYVAYLFANLAGISKVGTFSHTNGSSTDVDCGFSSGSSFVIVKRTDSTGSWYLWDSARGIVSGNDPHFIMDTGLEVTGTDYIDPLNSGFQIASGFTTGSYFFYAIAA